MTDLALPPALRHARNSIRYIDNTGTSRSVYNGIAQTTGYGGDRVAATIEFTPHGGRNSVGKTERRQLQSFLMALRGKQNRVYLFDDSYSPGGSWTTVAGGELFVNADFSRGTTGWTALTKYVGSVAEGVYRATVIAGGVAGYPAYQSPITTVNSPHVVRMMVTAGRGTILPVTLVLDGNAVQNISGYGAAAAVMTSSGVAATGLIDSSGNANAGDYITVNFASCSRCFLTDSGGNLFTKSRELDHSDWTKSEVTITANAYGAQDGTVDADAIIPSTNNTPHYILQTKAVSASASDQLICGYFRAVGYNFVRLILQETSGSTSAYQVFNLNTGAVGATVATGANWANTRAVIRDMGGGWYYCGLISRKTNAATSITGYVVVQNADNASNFAGNGTSGITGSKATLFPSGSFSIPVTSTTAAVAASPQQGAALAVKGLPASQIGLLVPGDWVEIDGQLKMLTVSLDSDSSGLGYLQFSPPLRRPVADNTPVIVHRPMGRFMLAPDQFAEFSNEPGLLSQSSLELEEA